MSASPLSIEAAKYLQLRERIISGYPEADEETLLDTLEGITDLHEMIAAVIRSALVDEALVSGLRRRIQEMGDRLSRLELRGEKKRQLAFEAMNEVGLKKLEQPDFTASLRAGAPTLLITAENEIPKEYWVPQRPRLARLEVVRALKQGFEVPGAVLSNSKPSLSVRTK